jgi:DNA gyrase/topoisomerase IV subunit B
MCDSKHTNPIQTQNDIKSVRRNPANYFGDLNSPDLKTRLAFSSLFYHDSGDKCCSVVRMFVNKNKLIVRYNVGMSLEICSDTDGAVTAEICLTLGTKGSSKPFSDEPVLFEFGLAALNAVCSRMFVKVCSEGMCAEFLYESGKLINIPTVMPCESEDYTEFEIELDASILPDTTFNYSKIVEEASRFVKMTGIPIRVEQII